MRESSRLYSGRGPVNVSSKIVTGPILSKLYSRQAGWLREAENPRTCHADNDMFPVVSSPTRYGSTTRVMPSYGKLTRRREAIASHRVVFFIFSLPNVRDQAHLRTAGAAPAQAGGVTDAGSAKHGRVGVGCIALFALFLLGPLDNPQKSQNPVAIGVGVHHWGIAKSGMSSLIGIDPLKRSPSAIQRLPFPPRDKSTKSVKRRDRLIHVMSPRLTSLATNPVPLVQMNPHLQNNAAEIMSGLLPSLPNHVLPGSPSAKDGTNQTADNARSYGISHKSWKELATGALILFVVAVLWKIIEAWIVSRQVDEMVRLMKDIGEQRKSYISANVRGEVPRKAGATGASKEGVE